MANPYSIIHNYDNVPLFKRDTEFIQAAMMYKQGVLNQNRSTVQTAYDQVANLDLVRDVDKEYASKRLQANLDIVNKYAGMDLSDPGLSASLVSNLNQTLDKNVRTALMSSKVYRMEQASWEKLKEEKPEKFAELNYNYQQQFAQPWLQSQQVGQAYRGGAGVKEFVDVNANLTKTLPEIAKNMKWEYVVDGGSTSVGGYKFRDAITKQEVSRDRVESAIESMLGPKEREQLQINAWGEYDKYDDATIKTMYESYITPKIENYKSQAESMRALAEQADPSKRDQYISAADLIDSRVAGMETNAYENVGKKGAYNAMYYDRFKNNYLNAYSYAPITVKEEVNAFDKAVFDVNMKINEDNRAQAGLNLQQQRFEFNKQQEASRLELDWAKLKQSNTKTGTGLAPGQTTTDASGNPIALPYKVGLSLIDSEEGYGPKTGTSNRDRFNEAESLAIASTKRLLNNHNLSENTLNSKGFLAAVSKYSGQEVIKFKDDNGQIVKLNLSSGDMKSLNNYRTKVLEDPAYKKRAYDRIQTGVNSLLYSMEKTAVNGDWNPDKLTNFNIMLDKDPNDSDRYIVRNVDKSKVDHYYSMLIKKKGSGKKLNDVENKNLQFYTHWMVVGDQTTSEVNKKLAFEAMQKKLWDVNDDKGLLPQNWYTASTTISQSRGEINDKKISKLILKTGLDDILEVNNNSSSVYYPAQVRNLVFKAAELQEQIDNGNKASEQELSKVKSQIRERVNITSKVGKTIFESYTPTSRDIPTTLSKSADDLENWDIEFPNAGKQLQNMWQGVNDEIEADTELTNLNPSKNKYTYSPTYDKASFETMNLVAGMPGFKGSYELIPKLNTKGVPTGEYSVFTIQVPTSGDDKGKQIRSEDPIMTLSEKDARDRLGIISDKSGNVMADATHGTYATEINLGTADPRQLSTRTKKLIAESTGSTFFPIEKEENNLLDIATQKGAGSVVQYHINNLKQGKYTFKLVSNGVTYDRVMYDDQGKELGRVDDGYQKLTDDQVVEVQRTATYQNQQAFIDIMKDIIRNHVVETVDQYRQNYYGQ